MVFGSTIFWLWTKLSLLKLPARKCAEDPLIAGRSDSILGTENLAEFRDAKHPESLQQSVGSYSKRSRVDRARPRDRRMREASRTRK